MPGRARCNKDRSGDAGREKTRRCCRRGTFDEMPGHVRKAPPAAVAERLCFGLAQAGLSRAPHPARRRPRPAQSSIWQNGYTFAERGACSFRSVHRRRVPALGGIIVLLFGAPMGCHLSWCRFWALCSSRPPMGHTWGSSALIEKLGARLPSSSPAGANGILRCSRSTMASNATGWLSRTIMGARVAAFVGLMAAALATTATVVLMSTYCHRRARFSLAANAGGRAGGEQRMRAFALIYGGP